MRYQSLRSDAEMRLADDRRRVAGPGRIVELEPECDVERKTPKPTDAARTAEKNLRLSGHQSATERESLPRAATLAWRPPPCGRAEINGCGLRRLMQLH